jgi:hypothetical protein
MTAHPIRNALMLAGAILAAALLLKVLEHGHVISSDMAARSVQAVIGLSLAVIANAMPKMISPREAYGRKRIALRIGGWAFTLAGFAYAGFSLFAPHDIELNLSIAAVAGAMVINLAVAAWACAGSRTSPAAD